MDSSAMEASSSPFQAFFSKASVPFTLPHDVVAHLGRCLLATMPRRRWLPRPLQHQLRNIVPFKLLSGRPTSSVHI